MRRARASARWPEHAGAPAGLAPLALLAILAFASDAAAQIVCGSVLGPGGTFTADADIASCAIDPAVRIVGAATVDFAGFAVSCDAADTAIGVLIEGKGAKVANGSVTGCNIGVQVGGEGKHKITEMLAEVNRSLGFRIDSAGNKLTHNTAWMNGFGGGFGDGFLVNGDKNKLTENWGIDNLDEGFEMDGLNVKLTGNVAATNSGEGIRADADKGTYKENLTAGNESSGFRINGPSGTFTKNVSVASVVFDGYFILFTANNKFTKNVAVGNNAEGFDLADTADDNKLTKSLAQGNGGNGIEVEGQGNTVKSSVAIGNADDDLVDLNVDCDDNAWSKNLFGTASPTACIE